MAHRNLPGRDGQRRASGNTRARAARAVPTGNRPSSNTRALPARAVPAGNRPSDDIDTLLALAREAGLLVTLDGQIGREKYQSVAGSVLALQRFAAALCARAAPDAPAAVEARRKARPGWPHANRLRNRTCGICAPLHIARQRPRVRRGAGRRHDLRSMLRTG
ncbi:hypothetical protein SD235_18355 (plasmid) [Burkholderia cepacia]|uniref:hypothetical protein n=1 Tax=Burkholderia cepacia TaxID=292 RepID=UPI003A4D2CE8